MNDLSVALPVTVRVSLIQNTGESTYLEFAEAVRAERVTHPASDLRASGKTTFAS